MKTLPPAAAISVTDLGQRLTMFGLCLKDGKSMDGCPDVDLMNETCKHDNDAWIRCETGKTLL